MGLLSDLLAFNFRHGDRHAQVLRWPMGASLRLSYRRIYLVLFPLHHYSRPCGHLDDHKSSARDWSDFILLELVLLEYILTYLGCGATYPGF